MQVGEHAFINLISIKPETPLPEDELLEYDFSFKEKTTEYGLAELIPSILYQDQKLPSFVIKKKISMCLAV